MCETFANSMAKGKRKRARKQANSRRIQANKAQPRDSSAGAAASPGAAASAESMAITPVSALTTGKTPTTDDADGPRARMDSTPAQLDSFADEIKSVWTDAGYEEPSPAPPSTRTGETGAESRKPDDNDSGNDDELALPLARGNSRQGLWLGLAAAGIALAVGSQIFGASKPTGSSASVSAADITPESSATAVERRSPLRSDPEPEHTPPAAPVAPENPLSEESATQTDTAPTQTATAPQSPPPRSAGAPRAAKRRAPAGDTARLLARAQSALRAGADVSQCGTRRSRCRGGAGW